MNEQNTENKASTFIVTFLHTSLCDDDGCECDDYFGLEFHRKIFDRHFKTHFDEKTINVKRGDLVRIAPAYKDEIPIWEDFYRNENLYIINKTTCLEIEELDPTIDSYGALPKDFVLYEEPDYFTQDYWIRDKNPLFGHAYYLWLEPTKEMKKNIRKIKNKKSGKYLRISTSFVDVRGNSHKIIFTPYNEEFDIVLEMKKVKKILKNTIQIELNDFDNVNDDVIEIEI